MLTPAASPDEHSAAPSRPRRRWRLLLWSAPLAVALLELGGHFVVRARVPEQDDWRAAAERVRAGFRPGDFIAVSPRWAAPLARLHLGDLMRLRDAGASDLAGYRRLWVLSIRGRLPSFAPSRSPSLYERFGRVSVYRWELRQPEVLYDFVARWRQATVERLRAGRALPCRLLRGSPVGGGLGAGPMAPAERFVCGPGPLWVGRTVLEDLALRPRTCIHQHPQGPEPIRVRFVRVPLGSQARIVLYAGLDYHDERKRKGPEVWLRLLVDGEERGRMVHRDGDGWKRLVVEPLPDGAHEVAVEVGTRVPMPRDRAFCWAGSVRRGPVARRLP